MKKLILVGNLLWFPVFLFAQLTVKTDSVGIHILSGMPVEARVFSSNRYINSWKVIDEGERILVAEAQTKGKGKKSKKKGTVACYNLKDGTTVWRRDINYKWQKPLFYDSLVLIEDYGSRLIKSYYDAYDGTLLHESSSALVGVLPDGSQLRWNTNKGQGVLSSVLINDRVNWIVGYDSEKIPSRHFMLDDSTLIVIAEGIHHINTVTGKAWHYNSLTSQSNHHALRSARALRLSNYNIDYYADNVVWSVYPVTATVENIFSNVHKEDDKIYWASSEKLVSLDRWSGEPRWEVPLGISETSPGQIFVHEGRLYHFNNGTFITEPHIYKWGEPYIAVYDASSGELSSKIITDKILSFIFDQEVGIAYINTPSGIYPYYMEEERLGVPLTRQKLGTEVIPFYLRYDAVIRGDEGQAFKWVYQLYPEGCFVVARAGKKCWVVRRDHLEVVDEVQWSLITVPQKITASHLIVADSKTTYFLDIAQRSTATVSVGYDAVFEDRYMFWCDGWKIYRVDLSDFMPEVLQEGNISDYGIDIDGMINIY